MTEPAPLITRLAHGTVGRLSPSVSMGVVQIGSAEDAVVQFLDAPGATELRVGQPVRQGGVTVTLLEAHPQPDFRASYLVVTSSVDAPDSDLPDIDSRTSEPTVDATTRGPAR